MRKWLFCVFIFLIFFPVAGNPGYRVLDLEDDASLRGGGYSQSQLGAKSDLVTVFSDDPGKAQEIILKVDLSLVESTFSRAFLRLWTCFRPRRLDRDPFG